jgi:hypothetical protein
MATPGATDCLGWPDVDRHYRTEMGGKPNSRCRVGNWFWNLLSLSLSVSLSRFELRIVLERWAGVWIVAASLPGAWTICWRALWSHGRIGGEERKSSEGCIGILAQRFDLLLYSRNRLVPPRVDIGRPPVETHTLLISRSLSGYFTIREKLC